MAVSAGPARCLFQQLVASPSHPSAISTPCLHLRRRAFSTNWKEKLGLLFGNVDTTNFNRPSSHVVQAKKNLLLELKSIRDEADAGPVEFESPLEIVLYPDPRLRAKNRRISLFDERLQQFVKEMFELMYRTEGVGLSAPQAGVNVQLMVFNPSGERGSGTEYVFVNPKIVKYGKSRESAEEGCLSFPPIDSIAADVERPSTVRIDAQDIMGKKFGTTFKGWTARIFQHEYDHLEGILFIDRMTKETLSNVMPYLMDLEDSYEKRTGKPTPETVKTKLIA